MNRVALFEQIVAVTGHLEVLNWFLANEDDEKLRVEFEGRCDSIESRLAQIRGTLAASERPDNVHVLGDRPTDRGAA